MVSFSEYLSPFSWRYASPEMRQLWSENQKRLTWRKIWVALAQAQSEFGLVSTEQVAELIAAAETINLQRALEIEAEIHHDLMAEVRTFAEQCPTAGGIIHLGATSMDIEDNAEALRMRQALEIILQKLTQLLSIFADQIRTYAATPIMAFTHLQPAEPSTLGYRLSFYAQDLLADFQDLKRLKNQIKGKGFKGAVGTAASYIELLGVENFQRFENRLSELLGLPFFDITSQTYPRRQDYAVLSSLAAMGSTLYKLAFDLRILQSPVIGEWSEPFGSRQVGSSAMPFKRNPIQAEKIDSLARLLASLPQVAWNNAAHSLLERTLDDSANRRSILPEAFLIADELLTVSNRIVRNLKINLNAITQNVNKFAPFAGTERLLMALVTAGANRQEMHERLRDLAMQAWQAVQSGRANPLSEMIAVDPIFQQFLDNETLQSILKTDEYTGIAEERAIALANTIVKSIEVSDEVQYTHRRVE
ncbi:adenylosuccinate lyase [Anaerolinea thermolimosa]|uniref:adenylosuccinate lyase n=1 Tax=Anaerolinea thermolimosa TaxID=229919 RepID=UPI000780DE3A|nr:adenylosuccinate lyase [Anaerolinea thermolimosa]GAP06781.1 adenylosuccinate lyase [Anaerolinea thermolimosa]